MQMASSDVLEGVIARMAYKEASGWLATNHVWVHEADLALAENHHTMSVSSLLVTGKDLRLSLPNTFSAARDNALIPDDRYIDFALRLARYWRRLAEQKTWLDLSSMTPVQEVIEDLNGRCQVHVDDLEDWLGDARRRSIGTPPLLRAAAACRWWLNLPGATDELSIDGVFLGALVWRERAGKRVISLPFWTAPSSEIHALGKLTGVKWTAGFLACVTQAARTAIFEAERLAIAERRAFGTKVTKRSSMSEALAFAVKSPVLTALRLAEALKISRQASSALIRRLVDDKIIREITGRDSWRAYTLR